MISTNIYHLKMIDAGLKLRESISHLSDQIKKFKVGNFYKTRDNWNSARAKNYVSEKVLDFIITLHATRTLKSEALDTYAMPFTTQPSMSATGTRLLPPISPKSEQKVNTTMSLFPMLPKS